jgi:hypothetical protein
MANFFRDEQMPGEWSCVMHEKRETYEPWMISSSPKVDGGL